MQMDIQHLTQDYGNGKIALKDLSLSLNNGIIGLLGPNGAGKSSLMRILATISQPSAGKVLWNGEDIVKKPAQIRRELGYLPQSFGVYDNLSATEFLTYLAGLKKLPKFHAKQKIPALLEMLNLSDVADKPLHSYSGGMKQRVGIAQALLNDPKCLIVDEPTVGLDPEERARFRDLLADMAEDRIIILSTHIVSDIESIADQIAIMRSGELLAYAKPDALLQKLANRVWHCIVPTEQVAKFRQQYCISHSIRQTDGMHLRVVSENPPTMDATPLTANLEDVFLYYSRGFAGMSNQIIAGKAA